MLPNEIEDYFSKYSEAIAVECNGICVYINEQALKIISIYGEPLPFSDWVPAEILSSEAPGICAVTEINGGYYMIILSRLDDMRIFTIHPQAKSPGLIEREFEVLSQALKSPLAALSAASNAMLPIVEGLGSEVLSKNIAIIYQNYFRLLRLSDMLSAYCEMNTGNIVLKPANVDLITLCKNLVDTVSLLTKESGVRIQFISNLKCADTEADFDRIEYVLLCILSRGLKHTKTGDDIIVSLSSTSRYFMVSVSVHGIAMPEEYLPKVFEPTVHFEKLLGSYDYVGLGLAYSAKTIEEHGGSMLIESREGKGTEIKFTLPIKNGSSFADSPIRYGEKGMVPILTYLSDILPLDCYDAKYLD